MTRKLASIRKINSIHPIDGADNIEKITIDGWSCVAKKGQFIEGDPCVYFEIDSFLPIRPEFEFLRKSSYKKMDDKEGFRLKTIRLRGVLSQGLAIPIDILKKQSVRLGDDVTDILGVIKFEPPIPAELQGSIKGLFPKFIRKTNQERVQNIWKDIKYNNDSFEVTIKLDGTSCTYYLNNGEFGVCGRNWELKPSESNTLWKLARHYKIEELLRKYGRNIALQGEVIGEGVNGNNEKIKGQDFYLFDIWDIDNRCYLPPLSRRTIYSNHFNELKHVNGLDDRCSLCEFKNIEEILSYAHGPSMNTKSREGIVFKSNLSHLSFKVISNEYLLKDKD